MRKTICILVVLVCIVMKVGAQEFCAPTIKQYTDTITTYTYKIDNTSYKVYKSKRGAYYIWKKSKKTNKPYKYYIPKEVQIKMGRKYDSN